MHDERRPEGHRNMALACSWTWLPARLYYYIKSERGIIGAHQNWLFFLYLQPSLSRFCLLLSLLKIAAYHLVGAGFSSRCFGW